MQTVMYLRIMNEGNDLRKQVEGKLQQKIVDLEAVRLSLEEDMRTSIGEERIKNQQLLDATNHLLQQLKLAQVNIQALNPDQ